MGFCDHISVRMWFRTNVPVKMAVFHAIALLLAFIACKDVDAHGLNDTFSTSNGSTNPSSKDQTNATFHQESFNQTLNHTKGDHPKSNTALIPYGSAPKGHPSNPNPQNPSKSMTNFPAKNASEAASKFQSNRTSSTTTPKLHSASNTSFTNATTVESATATPVAGNIWENWKSVFTVPFWKKRISDEHYIYQMLVPVAIGFAFGCLVISLLCFARYLCCSSRRRKLKQRALYFDKLRDGGDKWMLLERRSSDDEDEESV